MVTAIDVLNVGLVAAGGTLDKSDPINNLHILQTLTLLNREGCGLK